MSLFKREPRAVYRVYDEEDYLAGEEQSLAGDDGRVGERFPSGEEPLADGERLIVREERPAGEEATRPLDRGGDARLPRIGWLAVLAGAIVVVAVLIAVHVTASTAPQRPAPRVAPLSVPTTWSRARRAPGGERVGIRLVTRSAKPSLAPHVGDERSRRRAAGSAAHKAVTPVTLAPEQVESYTSVPSPPSAPPPAAVEAEFGFER